MTTATRRRYVYRDGRVRKLKPGTDIDEYLKRHPDTLALKGKPSERKLREWNSEDGCEAVDGCWVEPDGICEHGYPSWLMALGWI